MTDKRPSVLPLALISAWYMLLALGALAWLVFGLAWSSEVYRGRGMPLIEWATLLAPLLITAALLITTIRSWNRGKRHIAYALFIASLVIAAIMASLSGALGI